MGASVQPLRPFASLDPGHQARVRRYLEQLHAKGATDDEVEAYLRDVEGLAPLADDTATKPPLSKGSAAAGIFGAPLSIIPGATTATGVVQGLADAGLNLVRGQPAHLRESVRHGIEAQAADQAAADRAAPFTTAGVRGAAMALTAAPSALMRAATAGSGALSDALLEAGQQGARVFPTLAQRLKGAAARTAQNATTGAGYAMASRAGAPTTESIGERLRAAPGAALRGAAVGAALPAAIGAVAGRVSGRGAAREPVPTVTRGQRKAFTDIERSGQSLEDIQAGAAPNMTVADRIGRPAQRRLDWAMSVPTEAEPAAAEFLHGRQGDRGTRLQQGLEEALGTKRGNVVQQADALATTKKQHATVNYAAAEKEAPIDDGEVLAILAGSKDLRKLHEAARDMIQEETGRRPPPLVRIQRDPELGGAPVEELVPQPVAVFDMLKKAADDVIGSGFLGTKKIGRNKARILAGKIGRARAIVDAQRPDYAKARSEFRTDTRNEEALQAGRDDALRAMPEEIARDLPQASPEAQALYRQGAARNVFGHVTGTDATGGRALAFFSRPLEQQRVAALAAGPEKAAAFQQLLGREKTMAATEHTALRNSDTARRLQMNRDSEADESVGPETMRAGFALASGHPFRAAAIGAHKLTQAYQVRRNSDLAREIVNLYLSGRAGPEEFRQALEALKLARAQQVPVSALGRRRADPILARAAGLLSGAP